MGSNINKIKMKSEDYLEEVLVYHNAYIPDDPKDWEKYNKLVIEKIIQWFTSAKKRSEIKRMRIKSEFKFLRDKGMTLQAIANKYGTTRQYIHQVLRK